MYLSIPGGGLEVALPCSMRIFNFRGEASVGGGAPFVVIFRAVTGEVLVRVFQNEARG